MGSHVRLSDQIRNLSGDALGQPSRIHKDQRGRVLLDQFGETLVDLLPDLGGHDRFQRRLGKLQSQIAIAAMAQIDDRTIGRNLVRRSRSDQELCDIGDGILRCGQADAMQLPTAQRLQPLQRYREMRAALVRASAWISSTITVRVVASIDLPDSEPSRM